MHRPPLPWILFLGTCLATHALAASPSPTPSPAPASGYRLHLHPPALKQGAINLMAITGLAGISRGEVTLDGRAFPMEISPKGNLAWAIVGVDLGTKAPELEVVVRFEQATGSRQTVWLKLPVEKTKFTVDHLKLPPEMVNPPKTVEKRIEDEEKRLEQIHAQSTARQFRESFGRPVPGEVSSSFGRRRILNGEEKSPHSGTDIRSPEGRPVKAMNDGTVVLTDDLYFSGSTVILDHGHGIFTLYAHLSETSVKVGEVVKKKQLLGKVGQTGRATGPHLHLGLKIRAARLNPMGLEKLPLTELFSGKYPQAGGKAIPESAISE